MPQDSRPRLAGGLAVRKLADELRQHILSRCRPGERLPGIRLLVRNYGRSFQTVSRAMAMLAGQGLVERVGRSGNYVADPLPFGAAITGLFFYGTPQNLLSWPWYRDVLWGVLAETAGAGHQVQPILGQARSPASVTSAFIDHLGLERFNSIICLEVFNNDLVERLAERRVTVSVDFACHRPGVSSCAFDHAQNVNLAMEYLWMSGHRRIGYGGNIETGMTDPAHTRRLETYREFLRSHRITEGPHWVMSTNTIDDVVAMAETWVRTPPGERPTAIACMHRAREVALALSILGVQIPGEVSLISLARADSWDDLVNPDPDSLTSQDVTYRMTGQPTDLMDSRQGRLCMLHINAVSLPFRDMGRWAMRETIRRLNDPKAQPGLQLFPGTLTPGNTVAPPAR
ncbi:MAG: GntR family transcriptional regulator [Phycisphaerae bacterium]|nr:GntR family transcriptional regulator [Phycisphaerae bacterium]